MIRSGGVRPRCVLKGCQNDTFERGAPMMRSGGARERCVLEGWENDTLERATRKTRPARGLNGAFACFFSVSATSVVDGRYESTSVNFVGLFV